MEEVKQDYEESLKDLTLNSRPLIQGLTEIAQECSDYGRGVADAIEQHLSKVPPPLKIPTLYLMDSILKNIGEPYTDLFASRVYKMVTESYRHLPGPQKQKLQDLVKTWMTPQPKTGKPVFEGAIIDQISSFFDSALTQRDAAPPQRLNQSSVQVEINQMLTFLNSVVPNKDVDHQIATLERLQNSLSAGGADQAKLRDAQNQLKHFKSRQGQFKRKRDPQEPRDRKRAATGTNNTPVGTRDIFSSLASSGLFDTPIPSSKSSSGSEPAGSKPAVSASALFSSLSTAQPDISQLYSGLPLQCSVCGKRFPDTPQGQELKAAELDWHFRVNQDIRQGRSHSRMYLLTVDQWINYDDDEPEVEEAPAINFEEEAKKVVPVPDDHDEICHICGEKFNTIWSEDAEEWVFENAVDADGQIFHATCFADPNNMPAIEAIQQKQNNGS